MNAMRTRSRRAGHTLIEVMTAMVLLGVAGTGIVSMQGATTFATQQAQEMTVAVNFAQTWLERIKRDSLRWTAIGEISRTTGPVYVNQAPSGIGADIWYVPAYVAASNESYAADSSGFDVVNPAAAANIPRVRYCVNFRNVVQHLATDSTTNLPGTNTMRVDVRVWWTRMGDGRATGGMSTTGCETVPTQALLNTPQTREVFASTIVRWQVPE